jgi:SSS family solute:Na+ symporter
MNVGTVLALGLGGWDWAFVVWSLLVTTGLGLWYSRRSGRNLDEFFLSGRNLPWWALGTSMVATTFAADTPLAVAGFVVKDGVAGNWLWWNFLIGGTLTVFVFARWWRRSGVVTEVELIARRYDGTSAKALRAFKAVYLGLVLNSIIIGWVTKAMLTVVAAIYPDVDERIVLAVLIGLTLIYTTMSGLWGVVATDVLQFAMAMVGSILLAVLSVEEVGGLSVLIERVHALGATHDRDLLALFPTGWNAVLFATTVLVFVNWWAVSYPGNEPGGGGYVAQRMLAAKDERHARAGTLWFIIANFVLRPWPWILVALCALVLHPEFLPPKSDGPFAAERSYPAMFEVLPPGLYGLVAASFLAAYMSTLTSQLHLASSYLVNDLYLPLVAHAPRDPRREVMVARGAVVLVTAIGVAVSYLLVSVGEGWTVVMQMTAGIGLVLLLRWLWWRVNAWSEIAAMGASSTAFLVANTDNAVAANLVAWGGGDGSAGVAAVKLLFTVAVTTAVWIGVTFATRPVGVEHLVAFYRTVRPGGAWGPIARVAGIPPTRLGPDLVLWVAATALVAGLLFGVGSALFLSFGAAAVFLSIALVGGLVVHRGMKRDARTAPSHAGDVRFEERL